MNLYLHNIGDIYSDVPVTLGDALLTAPGYRVDYVLTNPPFGKKSSITFTNQEGEQEEEDLVYNRQDFWTTSSNKQLNFVQHINTILNNTGKAAVVVPDNVLFEGGAGETVRRKLLETTDLHTILRLPTGIFYKPGVKANVIFFDKRPASPEWQAVKRFQDNWDVNAANFPEMHKKSLSATSNLLANVNNFPAKMIEQFAEVGPEEDRAMFIELFDESKDIWARINNFNYK